MLKQLRETRKKRYWAVVCNVLRAAIFEKVVFFTLAIFVFSGKILFSGDRLSKCFRGSMVSPKHFLTILKFISSYPGLLFVFNEKKASFKVVPRVEKTEVFKKG